MTIGIGSVGTADSPGSSRCRQSRFRWTYSSSPCATAAARATASEAPSTALAPSRDLLSVPSSAISLASMAAWSSRSMPRSAGAISRVTFSTARRTPRPPCRRLSVSRSSSASCRPVLAPEGTIAQPTSPFDAATSTSTVGRPKESSTSRAFKLITVSTIGPFRPESSGGPESASPDIIREQRITLMQLSCQRLEPILFGAGLLTPAPNGVGRGFTRLNTDSRSVEDKEFPVLRSASSAAIRSNSYGKVRRPRRRCDRGSPRRETSGPGDDGGRETRAKRARSTRRTTVGSPSRGRDPGHPMAQPV